MTTRLHTAPPSWRAVVSDYLAGLFSMIPIQSFIDTPPSTHRIVEAAELKQETPEELMEEVRQELENAIEEVNLPIRKALRP